MQSCLLMNKIRTGLEVFHTCGGSRPENLFRCLPLRRTKHQLNYPFELTPDSSLIGRNSGLAIRKDQRD